MEEKHSVGRVKKTHGAFSFRIEGYSALSTRVGESVESPEFTLCGHKWQLRIFPGGSLDIHSGNVSFYLASKSTVVTRASYKLMVLSQVIGGIDEWFASSGVRIFEPKGVQVLTNHRNLKKSLNFASQVDGWGRDKFISVSYLMNPANHLFVNDSVVFKVEICVIGELESEESLSMPSTEKSRALDECMKELFLSPQYSDVTINASGNIMPSHRCILCARSPVFAAMLSLDMMERSSGVIEIDDIDPTIMREVLHYLYAGSLSEKSIIDRLTVELLEAASKYQICTLIEICEENICSKMTRSNALDYLVVGDTYASNKIKTKAFQTISLNYQYFRDVKELEGLDISLQKDVGQVIEMANKRHGCCGLDSERRVNGGSCIIV
jgi:speckle-type POZ protein